MLCEGRIQSRTSGRPGRVACAVGPVIGAALFLGALAHAVCYHARVEILPYDDAFIFLRYVRNLFEGRGLQYNPGERVFGVSSPLFMLWLCLVRAAYPGADLPTLAVRSNALWYVLSCCALAGLSRHLTGCWTPSLFLGILYALDRDMLEISSGGMESFLFVLLAIAALWALLSRRERLSAVLAGVAVLARPEGVFVLAAWGLCWVTGRLRRDPLSACLAAAPALLWTIAATLYYGTPIPHSIIARSAPIYLLTSQQTLEQLLRTISSRGGAAPALQVKSAFWAVRLIPQLGPLLVGILASLLLPDLRRRRAWLPGLLLLTLMAFYLVARSPIFEWYVPTIWALWQAIVTVGLGALTLRLWKLPPTSSLAARPMRLGGWLLVSFAAYALAGPTLVSNARAWLGGRDTVLGPMAAPRRRVLGYRAAAEWLNVRRRPGIRLAAPEIGALGYYWDGIILDACGLVSPQALPYLPVPLEERVDRSGAVGAIGSAFVRATRPEAVVSMPVFAAASIGRDPWFLDNYRLVATMPLTQEIWRSREVLVYARADRACELAP